VGGWLLALLLVVLAGDRLGAALCRQAVLRSEFRFSRIYRPQPAQALLVIGDSRGVHSFYAPALARAIGAPALNLSFNSMSMPIAEALVADYLEHQRPPRLVIIELTCVIVDGNLYAALAPYADLSPRLAGLYAAAHPRTAAMSRAFRLLRYDDELFLRSLAYLRRSDQDWINHGVVDPVAARSEGHARLREPKQGGLAALGRMVRLLRGRGVAVELVAAPYHPAGAVDVGPLLTSVRDAVSGVPGVGIHDYARAITENAAFADRVHLNDHGAALLLELLRRDGVLAAATEVTSPASQ